MRAAILLVLCWVLSSPATAKTPTPVRITYLTGGSACIDAGRGAASSVPAASDSAAARRRALSAAGTSESRPGLAS